MARSWPATWTVTVSPVASLMREPYRVDHIRSAATRYVRRVAHTSAPIGLTAPMQGTIVTIDLLAGQPVRAGQQVMLIESMKMHHAIEAADSGIIDRILVS